MYTTLNAAVDAIAELRDFAGSSLCGRTDTVIYYGEPRTVYRVLSNGIELARFTPGEGWYVDDRRYGAITSRHQSIVWRAIAKYARDHSQQVEDQLADKERAILEDAVAVLAAVKTANRGVL